MKALKTPNTLRQQGFTLIEVMIVVAILGILATLVVVNVAGNTDKALVTATKSDLQSIKQALDLFKLDNYRYPSTEQGLEALVVKPDNARSWPEGGYLSKVPVDKWDNPFVYISPGANGPFDLYSLGADGAEGGEGIGADISIHDL